MSASSRLRPTTIAATVATAAALGTRGPLASQHIDGIPGIPGAPADPALSPDPCVLPRPWTAAPPLAADTSHDDEMIFPKYKKHRDPTLMAASREIAATRILAASATLQDAENRTLLAGIAWHTASVALLPFLPSSLVQPPTVPQHNECSAATDLDLDAGGGDMRALRQLLDTYSSNTMKDGSSGVSALRGADPVYAVQPGPNGDRIYETQPPNDEQHEAFYLYPSRERNALVKLVVTLEAASQQVRALITSTVLPYIRFGAHRDRERYTQLRRSLLWFCRECDVFGGTTDPSVEDELRSAFSPVPTP